ncbi:N-acyl homoserine lactonase family protein [Phytoactinopolyspora mesophila]|uniref:MBL fold metallo-hydrolase n=1 Tax=Phytoactinopolyspora mesophila TaxID=2650750 RepID=A0A7K3M7S6_9ACTN|nr:N-acyl homoserine lactonase family protein [Phytoactinopolyspora mesophila]NDL59335.1 MBL fold metallo-hydrolase [Phytoactinopolyspora mesophila]
MTAPSKVHLLQTGVMECDKTWLLLKPGSTITDRSHTAQPAPWTTCPTHAVLIEHPDGRILWDTGVPQDWESRWAPTGLQEFFPVQQGTSYLQDSLAALELAPEDIDTLILSHLHFDHAANAKLFDNGKTRIMVNRKEHEGALGIDGPFKGAHLKVDYEGIDYHLVEGDVEIVPGVGVIETPGHTWGTMSLRVDCPDSGTKIFTSDAVYLAESWGPPAVGAAIVWDNLKWLESVEKLRRIVEETNAEVIFGHDPDQAATLPFAPAGHYS